MTKPNYTDKRTGIEYTKVVNDNHDHDNAVSKPHLDAFISPSFLKSYFEGKSNT
jgi:hypothetical protein